MVARKKNLEGNNLNLKNSFAVLDSLTLVNKFSKMGGNSDNINLEHFDLLKDLELARNDLKEKVESLNRGKEEVDKENLPLEELKFIEWTSDSSDPSDMEGFQMVSRRKKEKEKRNLQEEQLKPRDAHPNLLMGVRPLKEIYLAIALDIISGRGEQQILDIQNDRSNLKL
jgi:hypothetical protein